MVAQWHLFVMVCGCVFWQRVRGNPGEQKQPVVEGRVKLLWPIHFSSMPLSTPSKSSLESPQFGEEVARIGLAGFKKYVSSTLPRELEIDKHFAEEFANSDHSRINLAFMRWQRLAFARTFRINVQALSARGDPAMYLEGIDYSWPELYDSNLFRTLKNRLTQVGKLYMKRTGTGNIPKRLIVFPWVEVFEFGDSQRPWARTDSAFVMGRYFAKTQRGSLKFNFEDPRGINPPYGKTFSHAAFEGNLVMFPTWLSHFITPNMLNSTAVCIAFLVYPPDMNLDWEEDDTGSLVVERELKFSEKGVEVI